MARIRKQVYDLTAEDLRRYPLWEFCLDEEGIEGQDEATVKPSDPRCLATLLAFTWWLQISNSPTVHPWKDTSIRVGPTVSLVFSPTSLLRVVKLTYGSVSGFLKPRSRRKYTTVSGRPEGSYFPFATKRGLPSTEADRMGRSRDSAHARSRTRHH